MAKRGPALVPHLFDASSYSLTVYSLPTLLTMMAVFSLGVATLIRERISRVSVAFFLATAAVSIWLLAQSVLYSTKDPATALWWAKAAYLGIPFIAAAAYHFTVVVLHIYARFRPAVLLAWIVSAIFSGLAVGTGALFSDLYHYSWGDYARYDWLGLPFIIFFIGLLLVSMVHYWIAYHSTPPGRHKRRIRSLMLAFGVGYLGVLDLIPAYGIPVYPFGYLAILGFVLLSARAIFTYHLVDITPAFAANEIINTMNDALLVLDREGIIRLVNQAAVELLHRSREELLGKPISATLNDPFFTDERRFNELVEQGKLGGYKFVYNPVRGGAEGADVEKRYLNLSASIKPGRDHDPEAIVCILRDITEQKQVEEQMRDQNEYLTALHDTSLGLMNRLELSNLLEAIIQRAASLVGAEHGYIYVVQPGEQGGQELVVQAGTGVFAGSIGDRLEMGAGLAGKVWQEGSTVTIQDYASWPDRIHRYDGINFHAVVGTPLTSGTEVTGVLGIAHLEKGHTFSPDNIELLGRFAQLASIALDNARLYSTVWQELAERKRAEQEVTRLNQELERRVIERTAQLEAANQELEKVAGENARLYLEAQDAVRAREALLSVVSHDLRNLLMAVSGSVNLLQRHLDQPQTQTKRANMETGLARIARATKRMNALINEMLDFASLQAGQLLELHLSRTDMVALARRIAAEHSSYSERHYISVESSVPELVGLWDEARIERVFDNLLSNAIKYSPSGGNIHVELETQDENGALAVFSVRDSGIGIPASDLPHIFEWFRRAGNVTGRISGMGIGLASARQVIEQHGGVINVTSQEGVGSNFTVSLPREVPQ